MCFLMATVVLDQSKDWLRSTGMYVCPVCVTSEIKEELREAGDATRC